MHGTIHGGGEGILSITGSSLAENWTQPARLGWPTEAHSNFGCTQFSGNVPQSYDLDYTISGQNSFSLTDNVSPIAQWNGRLDYDGCIDLEDEEIVGLSLQCPYQCQEQVAGMIS